MKPSRENPPHPRLFLLSRQYQINPFPLLRVTKGNLSVALGYTLQLVLLLDSVGVAAALCGIDQLFGEALSNRLDVAESGLTGTSGEQGNGLVDTAERRNIDSLSSDGTGGANSGRVFAGTAVDDGVDGDLDGVLVGHEVDLKVRRVRLITPYSSRPCVHVSRGEIMPNRLSWHDRLFIPASRGWEKTYNLESVGDNADSHQLLAVVAAVHHE